MIIHRSQKASFLILGQTPVPTFAWTRFANVQHWIECQAKPPFLDRYCEEVAEQSQFKSDGVIAGWAFALGKEASRVSR